MTPARAERVFPAAPISVWVTSTAKSVAAIQPELLHIPALRVAATRSWQLEAGGRLDAWCIEVPTPIWLPGLQHDVLRAGAAITRASLGASELELREATRLGDGEGWTQAFSASGGALTTRAEGTLLFGFVAGESDALVCSASCRGSGQCDATLSSQAPLAPAPDPPWALEQAALHPSLALLTGALSFAAVVALILWRRPRPRW